MMRKIITVNMFTMILRVGVTTVPATALLSILDTQDKVLGDLHGDGMSLVPSRHDKKFCDSTRYYIHVVRRKRDLCQTFIVRKGARCTTLRHSYDFNFSRNLKVLESFASKEFRQSESFSKQEFFQFLINLSSRYKF